MLPAKRVMDFYTPMGLDWRVGGYDGVA